MSRIPRVARLFAAGAAASALIAIAPAAAAVVPASPPNQYAPLTAAAAPTGATSTDATAAAADASAYFVENVGQFDASARFQLSAGGQTWWLADDALWLTTYAPPADGATPSPAAGANVRISFPGADASPALQPLDRRATHVSYFLGSDSTKWHADVPVWGGVRYADLYPGVDLELSGTAGALSPRFVVHAGADLDAIRLHVDGAESLAIDGDTLHLRTPAGDTPIALPALVSEAGVSVTPVAPPVLAGATDIISPFAGATTTTTTDAATSAPDRAKRGLVYSTFVGGEREDLGQGIAVDKAGATYITGFTLSTDFPVTPGTFQQTCGSCTRTTFDAYVTKVSPNGKSLEYSTFLGGNDYDCYYSYAGDSCSIAVDAGGNAYIGGYTTSDNFPVTAGAYDRTCASCDGYFIDDAFVTKLNPNGTKLVYSTFLGGQTVDQIHGVVVDSTGAAFVTGRTTSTDFPTTKGAFQRTWVGGGYDAFVTKINPAGSALVYSTFLGGSDDECHTFGAPYISCGIAIDAAGNAYVTGATESIDFPTTAGVVQPECSANCYFRSDVYITKLNPTGTKLVYSTFLGSDFEDNGQSIAVDATGAAYIVGATASQGFPVTAGVFEPTFPGDYSAIVTKINPAGTQLVYSSFLGGAHNPDCYTCGDYGYGIALLAKGAVAVTGYTSSFSFPVTANAFQRTCGGPPVMCGDVFLSVVAPTADKLIYSTYLGGDYQDQGDAVVVGADGSIYVTGYTDSAIFPITKGAAQKQLGGFDDAFVAKFAASIAK